MKVERKPFCSHEVTRRLAVLLMPKIHGKYQRISTEIVEFSIGASNLLFSENDVFWTRHELSTRI